MPTCFFLLTYIGAFNCFKIIHSVVVDEEAVYMVSEVAVGMATSILSCSVWFVIMITRVVPSLVPRLISHIASNKSLRDKPRNEARLYQLPPDCEARTSNYIRGHKVLYG